MARRSGRAASLRVLAPLLLLLLVGGTAAVPFSAEKAYRDARTASNLDLRDEATKLVDVALARAGTLDNEWVWSLRVLKAELLAKTDKPELALQMLAPELPAKYRRSEAAVRRLLALGIATRERKYADAALALASKDQPKLVYAAHLVLSNIVDFEEAERRLRTALQLATRDGDRIGVMHVHAALAWRYTRQQRYSQAVEAGEQALAAYKAVGATGRIAAASGNLGWAYLELGEWERARELFLQAEAAAERVRNETEQIKWLQQLGNVEFAQRRYAEAERYYTHALTRARALTSAEQAPLLTNLARLAVETGRTADAKGFVAEALSLAQGDQKLRAKIVDARADMLRSDFVRAEKTLREVVAAQAETSVTRWVADAYLAQLFARTGRNDAAEAAYRRAIDTVRATRQNIAEPEHRLAFFNVAQDLFGRYVDFLMSRKRVEDALAATELIRAQTLEEGLGRGTPPRKLDARAIAKQRNATILCYFLGRDRSWVWTVTPNAIAHAPLPPDTTITLAVQAYARNMRDYRSSMKVSGARAQALYGMLVAPALQGVARPERVVIVADGALHLLNFETLVVPGTKPRYWIEDVTLSSAGSLQLLGAPAEKKNRAGSLLLVGDPPVADRAYPRLPFAKKELDAVAAQFRQRTVLAGANATPAAYRAAGPGKFDFVHFVAHGVATRARPLESAVILGADGSKQYKLFARDIVGQPLAARLVTISSCHGAGGRTFAGEGLVGLAWAFLGAGADEVIAALWEVNDSATPELMAKMYAGIRAGREPAVALREAKLALVRGKGATSAPRYWAPFVLYSGG